MQNENLIVNQPAPVVEKVAKNVLKTEKTKLEIENNKVVNDFINTVMALSDEDLEKALAFVNKKVEMLKNIKK